MEKNEVKRIVTKSSKEKKNTLYAQRCQAGNEVNPKKAKADRVGSRVEQTLKSSKLISSESRVS